MHHRSMSSACSPWATRPNPNPNPVETEDGTKDGKKARSKRGTPTKNLNRAQRLEQLIKLCKTYVDKKKTTTDPTKKGPTKKGPTKRKRKQVPVASDPTTTTTETATKPTKTATKPPLCVSSREVVQVRTVCDVCDCVVLFALCCLCCALCVVLFVL